jgi:hypothetical protein
VKKQPTDGQQPCLPGVLENRLDIQEFKQKMNINKLNKRNLKIIKTYTKNLQKSI